MADPAQKLLTVDEYVAVTAELDDDMKWELIEGVLVPKSSRVHVVDGVVAMAPERRSHARMKFLAAMEIERAVQATELPCVVTVDGMGVAIGGRSSFIPDIIVECGAIDTDSLFATSPTIVVEVLSPSTRAIDMTRKVVGYFRVETIKHYLIVDGAARTVQHHFRDDRGIAFETHSVRMLRLDPPDIAIDLEAFFE